MIARHASLCLTLLLGVALVTSCEQSANDEAVVIGAEVGTPLIDGLISYSSIDSVRKRFFRESETWETIEDTRNTEDATGRPPFRIYSVRDTNFVHLECNGELTLSFFNDRLVSTVFYPGACEDYFTQLGLRYPGLNGTNTVQVYDYTDVSVGEDYRGQSYAAWRDRRLMQEMSRWIKDNA